MTKQELAARVKTLKDDQILNIVLGGIQDDASAIFMNPSSDDEQVLKAHQAIQAVGYLERAFDAIEADAQIANDRES